MIKAIIFDFDGVLVESMDVKAKAFAYLFKDYPASIDRIVKFHMLHGGLSRFEKFEFIYKNILRKKLPAEIKVRLGEKFASYVYEKVIKCPFVGGALEFLDSHYQKMSFFIVSGTPYDELHSIIKARNIEKYFVEIFGTPGKKSFYNMEILRKYGFATEQAIVVGDSIDDYQGAKESGLKFVGRINSENQFKNLKIEAVINNLFDLKKIINDKQI